MKHFLLKTMLLLCALVVGSSAWGQTTYKLEQVTSLSGIESTKLYVFEQDGYVMSNSTSSSALQTTSTYNTTGLAGNEAYVWKLEANGSNNGTNFYFLRNASKSASAAYLNNTSSTSVSFGNSNTSVKWYFTFSEGVALIKNNGNDNRFLGYTSSTSHAYKAYATSNLSSYPHEIKVYKLVEESTATLSSIAVTTPPTKTEYKTGENFSAAGMVVTGSYSDESTKTISDYTMTIGETALANGDALNAVGTKTVTITYGGKSTTQTIYVGSLTGIAVTAPPTKITYDEGQTFNPAGMEVTATYDTRDGHTWTELVSSEDYTYDLTSPLVTANTSVTISYNGQTANQAITVNAGQAYTVTFNAGTGSCATESLDEASFDAGVTLPTATIGVTGWAFAGWATASTTNTGIAPTLYAAGDTYHPTDNTILYAVYKFVDGTEGQYKRASSVSEITSASTIVAVCTNASKTLTYDLSDLAALSETEGFVTPSSEAVLTFTGNNTSGFTISGGTNPIGATSLPSSNGSSTSISLTSTNSKWIVQASTCSDVGFDNQFVFKNTNGTNVALQYSNSAWLAYRSNSYQSLKYYAHKVYIPNWSVAYNSNPAAIVNPTIAWTTAGDKNLYVQDDATYNNAANVTDISKTPVYNSSDETVATVSNAGVVNALKAGTTTITAKVAAETGMNTEASVSYVVTVKDAKTIAGIKTITSSSSVVSFTADLTDAVVTYVNGSHAFIQDASGAVYASCGSSLTAGKKINGAVSGSVKAANQIDEITAVDLSDAEVTDGVIPAAAVISAATLSANKADYEGKLVSIEGATVTTALSSGSASGGKISDDNKVTEINLYAPDSNIEALKDAEGTFNGYITLYGGSTVRFNIFEQSQITLTKNASTAQPLAFASDAVELDEETSAYSAFTGQEVSGAKGAVTYSIESDAAGVVTSINDETGAVVLSGNYGTATIKASAAAAEVTEAGVTTPYTATEKTYTITVYPRYIVTFSVNGVKTELRQASHGAEITVPTPITIDGYSFRGWSTSEVATTDDAPSMQTLSATITPEENATYCAVYALMGVGPDENVEFYKNTGSTGTNATTGITAAGNVNTNSSNGNPGNSFGLTGSNVATITFSNIDLSSVNSADVSFDYKLSKANNQYSSLTLTQYDSNNSALGDATVVTNTDQSYHNSGKISLNKSCVKFTIVVTPANGSTYNTFVDNVTINVTRPSISYSGYTTSRITGVENRSMATDKIGTICLPYAVEKDDIVGAIVYTVAGKTMDGDNLQYVTISELEGDMVAGTPYIFKATADAQSFTFVPTNKAKEPVTVNTNGLVGSFEETEITQNVGNYIFSGGLLYLVDSDDVWVGANRAYINLAGVPDNTPGVGVKGINIFADGVDPTAISAPFTTVQSGVYYNLQGQRVENPTHGIYILNGKKVFIK